MKFLGACSDVYDRLKDYHVGLMCSKAEGFGRVTIEYMHASLVVIASDGGANPELIRDRETGLLYTREDTKTLTEKMIYLWEHRDKMAEIADKGQIEAKKYTKQNNAYEIFMEYCRVKEQQ